MSLIYYITNEGSIKKTIRGHATVPAARSLLLAPLLCYTVHHLQHGKHTSATATPASVAHRTLLHKSSQASSTDGPQKWTVSCKWRWSCRCQCQCYDASVGFVDTDALRRSEWNDLCNNNRSSWLSHRSWIKSPCQQHSSSANSCLVSKSIPDAPPSNVKHHQHDANVSSKPSPNINTRLFNPISISKTTSYREHRKTQASISSFLKWQLFRGESRRTSCKSSTSPAIHGDTAHKQHQCGHTKQFTINAIISKNTGNQPVYWNNEGNAKCD